MNLLPEGFFAELAARHELHARDSAWYADADVQAKRVFREAKASFEAGKPLRVAEFGEITLPYVKMGAIDSIDLFGLDELVIFAYYLRNAGRYPRAADIGANLGLHTILLAKSGAAVDAYEPDPQHYEKLNRNLQLNGVAGKCRAHLQAVSDQDGKTKFVRVLGNTTSSHLAGAKPNPYGELEYFDVEVTDVRRIAAQVDFMKIDAEGHEAVLLRALPVAAWGRVEAFVEIGSPENAQAVFDHFAGSGVNLFAQKRGWKKVASAADMPVTYKEGGIFVSAKPRMDW
jgi:FkbM family methyltransferase